MTEFMLDTDAASRLLRLERPAIAKMRRSGAQSISVSGVTASELLYGAHLRNDKPDMMRFVRNFLLRVTVHPWDETVAETHAGIRATAKRLGRSADPFDIMIAAHALSRGATLVTKDAAIIKLKIDGLAIVSW